MQEHCLQCKTFSRIFGLCLLRTNSTSLCPHCPEDAPRQVGRSGSGCHQILHLPLVPACMGFVCAILEWSLRTPLVVKNPPSNAGEEVSIPGEGTNISRVTEQLSPRPATIKPAQAGAHNCWSLHDTTRELGATTKDPKWCNEDPTHFNEGLKQPNKQFFFKEWSLYSPQSNGGSFN